MSKKKVIVTKEIHRQIGVNLFNYTWDLLEKKDRTPEEAVDMIHSAHASRHHWGVAGDPVNWTRGEWQVSRVYAALKLGESALYHAKQSLELCQKHGIKDFDLAFAHEAVARAFSVTGDQKNCDKYLKIAKQLMKAVVKKEDRDWLAENLESIP